MNKHHLLAFISSIALLAGACSGDDSATSGSGTDTATGTDSDTSSGGQSSTSTSTTSGATTSGSASMGNTSSGGGACVPGQSVACTCGNGEMGAQVCADDGMSFLPCECVNPTTGPSTTTGDPTTTTDPTTGTTTDPTTGTTDATTGTTTGGMDMPYGPCPGGEDNECLPDEQCVVGMTGGMNGFMWSICTSGTCMGNNQCDVVMGDLCADLPGDGQLQLYCVPQTCSNQMPCPDGMMCAPGFGGNNPNVCVWPS